MAEDPAALLVDLIPHLMQAIRHGMRTGGKGEGLSIPQFRTLAMVAYHPGASLSEAAAHVGLGAPATSVIVDGLVRRRLLSRAPAAADRRRSVLAVTPGGRQVLVRARNAARRVVAGRLAGLAPAEQASIAGASRLLLTLFAPQGNP
jgi:DNA-binding MarR family transcriptional regulator